MATSLRGHTRSERATIGHERRRRRLRGELSDNPLQWAFYGMRPKARKRIWRTKDERAYYDWQGDELNEQVGFACDKASYVGANLVWMTARQHNYVFKDQTGTLRASIKLRKSRYKYGGYVVRATAPHAHLVELGCRGGQDWAGGWLGAVISARSGGGPQAPRPFMRKALEENRQRIRGLFMELFGPAHAEFSL